MIKAYKRQNGITEIFCRRKDGKNASVFLDTQDFLNLFLLRASVSIAQRENRRYAKVYLHGKHQYLHRLIANPPLGMVVDHVNDNGLDNRRSNLRIVPQSYNILFARHPRIDRGIRTFTNGRSWFARIKKNGKEVHLGTYPTFTLAKTALSKYLLKIEEQCKTLDLTLKPINKEE